MSNSRAAGGAFAFLFTVFFFALSPVRSAQLIYFDESPRGLYTYDTTTGVSSLRAAMIGSERFFGMDRRPSDGSIFAVDLFRAGLWTINRDTGSTQLIA